MIRALGKKGGVVFINFNAAYLDKKAYDVFARNGSSGTATSPI